MIKIIILLRNIITFLISQFKVFPIFHQVCEYFRFISHEFCVFDLNQSFLFFIQVVISNDTRDYSAPTVKYVIHFLRFSNLSIFLSIDFQTGNMAERSTSQPKEGSVIQKKVSFKSSELKI